MPIPRLHRGSVSVRAQNLSKKLTGRVIFAFSNSLLVTPVIFYTRTRAHLHASHTRGVNHRLRSAATAVVLAVVLVTGLAATLVQPANAVASSTLNFQAKLEGSDGAIAPDGNYNVEFKLYSTLTGGTALWTEDHLNSAGTGIRVVDGYLTTELGSVTAFPSNMPWDQSLYVTMNIGGTATGSPTYDGEMNPRLKLTAVPYAFQAKNAEQLQVTANGFVALLQLTAPTTSSITITAPNQSGTICLENDYAGCGFASAAGSTGYIQNGTALQTTANFNIQTAATSSATAVIRALTGQTADLLTFRNAANTANTSGFNASGQLYYQSGSYQGILAQATLGQNTTYNLPDPGTASAEFCLLYNGGGSNCAGAGSGITGTGTINRVARFNSGSTINASQLLYDNDTIIGVGVTSGAGVLNVAGTSTSQTGLFVTAVSSSTAASAVIKAASSQTGNLIEFQDASATPLTVVGADGSIFTSAPATFGSTTALTGTTGELNVLAGGGTSVGQILRAGSSQTGDLLSLQNNSGTVTSGFNASGQLFYNSGSFNGILAQASLGQSTTYTLPDPGSSTAQFCLLYSGGGSNCAGAGSGITGSGTTNYVARFNSGSTVGASSLIFDNSSLVGVGTTSGSAILNIKASGTTQNSIYVLGSTTQSVPVAVIRGGASPDAGADLLNLQADGGATVASFDRQGNFMTTGSAQIGNGLQVLAGGAAITGTTTINTGGTANTSIGNSTGSFSLVSSGLNVTTGGALSGITTLTASGAITAATTGNTINGLIINGGALSGITGYTQLSGNFDASASSGSFDTSSGQVNLNGNTSVTGNGNFTTGSGSITLGSLGLGLVQSDASGLLSSGAVSRNDGNFFTNTLSVANGGTGSTTFTANGILYGSGSSAIQSTGSVNNAVLITGSGGVPSLSQTLPLLVQGNITQVGALSSGSIATGFGVISTANNITTTATITGNVLNATGAGAVIQLGGADINAAGTLTNVAYLNQANSFTGASNTFGGAVVVQGSGGLTLGTNSTAGKLIMTDGSGHNLSFISATQANNVAITIPADTNTTDELCLKTLANCGTAGAILGSGTQNYVAKFDTGTGHIGNSSIFDNGTFVGINNNSIGTGLLSIVGASSSQSAFFVQAAASAATPAAVIKGGATPASGGDLLQLQDSNGNILAKVAANGDVTLTAGLTLTNQTNGGNGGILTTNATGQVSSATLSRNSSAYFNGALNVANGGTGLTSLTTNSILYATGTTSFGQIAGTSGQVLLADASGVPTFTSLTGDLGIDGSGATLVNKLQGNTLSITSPTAGQYIRYNGATSQFENSALQAGDISGTLFTLAGSTGSSQAVTAGSTVSLLNGSSNNLTTTASSTNTITIDIISNPTFSGTVTSSNSAGVALAATGTPTASATSSLVRLGAALAGGNAATNGGTYLGINAPNTGAGSAADFLNFQVNGTSKLLVSNTGALTLAGAISAPTSGDTINGLIINAGALSGVTGYTQTSGNFSTGPGTVTLGSLGTGLVQSSASGVLSSGAVDRNSSSYFNTTLSVTNGGTGLASLTTNSILYATGTSSFGQLTGTAGQLLLADASGVPTFTTLTGDLGIDGAGATTINKLQGNALAITSPTTGQYIRYNGTTSQFENSALQAGDISGTLFTLAGSTGTSQNVNSGTTVSILKGASNNLTTTASATNTITVDIISNPTFSGTVTSSNSAGVALAATGAPTASATTSLVQLGAALVGGNAATNGGTYLGINAPNTGAGSAADFLNFQVNGTSKLVVDNTGLINTAGGLAVGGTTVITSGRAAQNLTGVTSSGTIQFSSVTNTGGTAGLIVGSSNGTLSSVTVDRNNATYFNTALTVANGGTGLSALTTNSILYASGANSFAQISGTAGQVLLADASGVPTFTSMGGDISLTGAGVATINKLQGNNLSITSPTGGQYLRYNGTTSQFENSIIQAADISGTLFTVHGGSAGNVDQPVAGGQTLNLLPGASNNLTIAGSNTRNITFDIIQNPTFTGAVTASNSAGTALAVTGTPTASATSAQLLFGASTGFTGNTTVNGGTYIGINAPASGAGSAADFVNFQVNGTSKFAVDNTGLINTAGGLSVGGSTVITSGRVAQNLTGVTSSGTVQFSSVTNTGGTAGLIVGSSNGTLSSVTVDRNNATYFNTALTVANGGTNLTSLTTNSILYASSSSSFAQIAGTAGQILFADASGVPTFTTLTGDVTVTGAGVATINKLQGNNLSITSPAAGQYIRYNSTTSQFENSIIQAADISGTLFTVHGGSAGNVDQAVAGGQTLNLLPGASNNLTIAGSNTRNITFDIIQNPTFTGTMTASNSSATALAVTGTPTASATAAQLLFGASGTFTGNASTNGGTYIGINAPASGAGSAADFLNLQVNGASKFKVSNSGALTLAGAITGPTSGNTINGLVINNGTLAAATTGDTINGLVISSGSLSGITGYNQTGGNFTIGGSGTITLSSLGAGLVKTNASGVVSSGAVDRNSSTYFNTALTVGNGGTGLTTLAANGVLYADTTSSVAQTSGTAGQVLIAGAGGVPSFTSISGDISLNGSGVATVNKLQNNTLTITTPGSGQYLRYDGSAFVNSAIQATDVPSLSAYYINNSASQQTSANFNIQALSGTVAAKIQGASGQNIIEFFGNASSTTPVASIDGNGNLTAVSGNFSGTLTSGTASSAGSLVLNNGSGQTATIQTGAITGSTILSLPTNVGASDTFCLVGLANCTSTTSAAGSTNYIGKFTSATALGAQTTGASLYDDGNFFGVGTTTNNGLVSIQGIGTAQTSLYVTAAANATAAVATIVGGATPTATADLLDLFASGGSVPLAKIDRNGNVYGASFDVASAGVLHIGQTNATSIALDKNTVVTGTFKAGSATQFQVDASGNVSTTGSTTTAGLTNSGSTLNTALTLGNFATGGSIGAASSTVDVATTINIPQTTTGQTLTLPNPTTTTAGRIIYVNATSTAGFTIGSNVINAGQGRSFLWNGTAWTIMNATYAGTGLTQSGNTINSAAPTSVSNDVNVQGSIAANVLTLSFAGTLGTTRGGTGLNTYTAGGLLYASTSSTLAQANGTAGQFLLADASGNPSFTSLGGDLTGSATTPGSVSVSKLQGNTLTITSATAGQYLRYNGSAFVNSGVVASDVTGTLFTVHGGSAGNTDQAVTSGQTLNFLPGASNNLTVAASNTRNLTFDIVSNPTFSGLVTSVGLNAGSGVIQTTGALSAASATFTSLGTGLVTSNSGGVLSSGTVDRNSSSYFNTTLTVANGGTGQTSLTTNGILFGNGSGAIGATAAAANSILATDGSNVPGLTQTLPSAVQGNITSTGALASGSITTGFGTISTANNITTTTQIQGGSFANTGSSFTVNASGNVKLALDATSGATLVCQNASGLLAGCTNTYAQTNDTTNFIRNQTTSQAGNFNVFASSGVAAVLRGASGQDIAQFQNNASGAVVAKIDSTGALTAAAATISNLGTGLVTSNASGTLSSGAVDRNSSSYFNTALTVTNGGTGLTSLTTNSILYASGASSFAQISGTTGQVLLADASGVPTFTSLTGDVGITGAGATTINKLQGNTLTITSPATGQYIRYNGSAFVNAALAASDLTGTVFSVTGSGANAQTVSGGQTVDFAPAAGGSGNLTVSAGATRQVSFDIIQNPTFTGAITASNSSGIALKVNGTPTASATSAQLIFGDSATFTGNNTANGGTYIGVNQPSSGAGSTADFLNFQVAGATKLKVTSAGLLNDVGGYAISGTTVIDSSRNATNFANLAASGTVQFSGITNAGAGGLLVANTTGGVSAATVDRNSSTYFNTTLNTANGGTGLTGFTANGLLYASTTSALAQASGTSGQLLLANASGVPTFTTLSGDLSLTSAGAATVNKLQGNTLTISSPATGQYIRYNGSAFVNSGIVASDVTGTLFTLQGSTGTAQNVTAGSTVSVLKGASNNLTVVASATNTLTIDIVSNPTFSGLVTASAGLTIASGQNLTVNGDAISDLTGAGLSVSGGALTVDDASSTGFFRNGGNNFGGNATLGTTGAGQTLSFTTAGTNRLTLDATGNLSLQQASTINAVANPTSNAAGYNITVAAGAANGSSTGNVGGILALQGGAAAGTGNNNGGNLTIDGGAKTGTGVKGYVVLQGTGGNVGIGNSSPVASLSVGNNPTLSSGTAGIGNTTTRLIATVGANIDNAAGVIMGNTSTGTSADFRFAIADTNEDYLAFALPGVNNTGTLFGNQRNTSAYLFTNTANGTGRNLTIGTVANKDLIFGTNNTERLRIQGNGNIGIGTSGSASALLSVGGTTGNFTVNSSGNVKFVMDATTGTSLVCQNASGLLAGCTNTYAQTNDTTNFIRNQTSAQAGNFNVFASSGVAAVLRGASGQDIAQFQNNATGAVVAKIDSLGKLTTTGITVSGFGTGLVTSDASGVLSSTTSINRDSSSYLTGTLSVGNGGTGATTFASNGLLYGNTTGAVQATSAGTAGQFLLAGAGGTPAFASLGGDLTGSTGTPGSVTVSNLQGNTLTITSAATGQYLRYNGSAFVNAGITAADVTGTLFTLAGSTGTSQSVTTGSTVSILKGASNNLTSVASATNTITVDIVSNPSFSGTVTASNSTGIALAVSGTPTASATSAQLFFGSTTGFTGSSVANGGTYIGVNEPNSGAGSAADFLNFQVNGTSKLKVDNSGVITTAGGLAVGATTVIDSSRNATFATVKDTALSTAGLVTNAADGTLGTVASINRDSSSYLTGTLSVGNGGTGATTLAANGLVIGNGTSAVSTLAAGAANTILQSNGTSASYVALSGDATLSAGALTVNKLQGNTLTISSPTTGQYIRYNGSAFVNSALQAGDISGTIFTVHGGSGGNVDQTVASGQTLNFLAGGSGNLTVAAGNTRNVTFDIVSNPSFSGLVTAGSAKISNLTTTGFVTTTDGVGTLSSGKVDRDSSSYFTGNLSVANGGTGATTFASNGLLIGNGTSAVSTLAAGAANTILQSNGTTASYVALSGDASLSGGTLTVNKLQGKTLTIGASPVGGDLLLYNGTAFVNQAVTGDVSISGAGVTAINKLQGNTLTITTPGSGQYLRYNGSAFVNSAITAGDVTGTLFTLAGSTGTSQAVTAGSTVTIAKGSSNNLTTSAGSTNTVTIDIVSSPSFSGTVTSTNSSGAAFAASGTPNASASAAMVLLGDSGSFSGNSAANGGTYLGVNAPSSGTGSAADFLNFQVAGTSKLKVTAAGALTTTGVTVTGFGAGLVTSNASGVLSSTATINRDSSTFLTGTLSVGNGGTGQTTLTSGALLLGNGTSGVTSLAPGANNTILQSNGTTASYVALSGDASLSGGTLTVNKLQGKTLTIGASPVGGDLLLYNGTAFVNQAVTGDVTINSSGVTAIGASKVTNTMLQNNSITYSTAASNSNLLVNSGTSATVALGGTVNLATVSNPTFTGTVTASNGTTGLFLNSSNAGNVPGASTTTSLLQIGSNFASTGNASGTFIGINSTSSTSADFLNFQNNGAVKLTVDSTGLLNARGGFSVGANAGIAISSCTGYLNNPTFTGGILTAGGCATAASTLTLQNAYTNSGTSSPQILLNNTNGGIKIADGTTPVGASVPLFDITDNGQTNHYLSVFASKVTSSVPFLNSSTGTSSFAGEVDFTGSGNAATVPNGNFVVGSGAGGTNEQFTANNNNLTQVYNNVNGNAFAQTVGNVNTGNTTTSINAFNVNLQGSVNSNGAFNNTTGLRINATTTTGNNFYGLDLEGTGFKDLVTYNGTQLISGAVYIAGVLQPNSSGRIQNVAFDPGLSYTNINKVGALNSGSIVSGFGSITTANNITTTALLQADHLSVGSNSGTPQFTITSTGDTTTSGTLSVGPVSAGQSAFYVGGTGALQLTSTTSGTQLTITSTPAAAAATSLIQLGSALNGGGQSSTSGTYIGLNAPNAGNGSAADFLNLQKNGTTQLLVTNSGAVTAAGALQAASITATGAISAGSTVNATTAYKLGGSVGTAGQFLRSDGTTGFVASTLQANDGAGLFLMKAPSSTGNNTVSAPTGTIGLTIQNNGAGTDRIAQFSTGGTVVDYFDSNGSLNVGAVIMPTASTINLGASTSTATMFQTGYFNTSIVVPSIATLANTTGTANGITIHPGDSGAAGSTNYTGANVSITAGNALGTGAGSVGGNASIDAGTATTNGVVNVGTTNASTVNIGVLGRATSIKGSLSVAQAVSVNSNTVFSSAGLLQNSAFDTTINYSNLQKVTLLTASSGYAITGATTAGHYLRNDGTKFVDSALLTSDLSGALFTLSASAGTSQTVNNGSTMSLLRGSSNNLTTTASATNTVTIDLVPNPSVNSLLIANTNTANVAFTVQNASGQNALTFDTPTGLLKVWDSSVSTPANYAYIGYANNTATFSASSGITQIGAASGNVNVPLTGQNDHFTFTKTYTPVANYSLSEFVVQRILTGGSNTLTGNVASIEDRSTGSNNSATVLYLNENNASASGFLIQAQTTASLNQLTLDTAGNLNIRTGYQTNGVAGISSTCSSGQTLVNSVISGGIVTAGTCSITAATLQDVYNNSGSPATITTTSGSKGFLIQAGVGFNSTALFQTKDAGGANLLTVDSTNRNLQIGSATTDTTQVNLVLDSDSAFSEAAACNTASNPTGALYFNTASNAVRACIGSSWEDLVSTAGLGIMLYGVVPDSGSNPGDLPALGTTNVTGPCKVSWASTTSVNVAACTAYSGGRKVIVPASTITITGLTTTNIWAHICLNGTNNQPVLSAGAANELANQPTFSVTAPILCLADIKGSASTANNIAQIYDVRTFTNSQKEFVTVNGTSASLGQTVIANGANVTQSTAAAATSTVMGVVVATNGSTSTTAPNAILAVAGPAYAKATAGSAGQFVQTGATTAGYAATSATAAFGNLGIARNSFNATCNSTTTCIGSVYFNESIR